MNNIKTQILLLFSFAPIVAPVKPIEFELLLIEALVDKEFWTIELKGKIATLDAVVKQTVNKMKNDFCITNK